MLHCQKDSPMLKIKLVSRITIASTFLICQMLSSCIPGFDTVHSIKVKNCTRDTLIIGGSLYNCFDSVDVFLEASNDTAFSSFTSIDESGYLNIHGNLILPDSIGRTTYSSLFNRNHTGYLFIIKLSNARKYAWADIGKHKLYDIKVVTPNDELQYSNKIIEVNSSK